MYFPVNLSFAYLYSTGMSPFWSLVVNAFCRYLVDDIPAGDIYMQTKSLPGWGTFFFRSPPPPPRYLGHSDHTPGSFSMPYTKTLFQINSYESVYGLARGTLREDNEYYPTQDN